MALYEYKCEKHGRLTLEHPMSEVDDPHRCPLCRRLLRRVFTPIHHWWPSNFRPGNEDSGQRMFLDPENQARWRDEFEETKEHGGLSREQYEEAKRREWDNT